MEIGIGFRSRSERGNAFAKTSRSVKDGIPTLERGNECQSPRLVNTATLIADSKGLPVAFLVSTG